MDGTAVQSTPDLVLTEFGLYARGDIFALRAFCEQKAKPEKEKKNEKEERKRKLLDLIRAGRKSKQPKSQLLNVDSVSSKSIKEKKKIAYIGWMHEKYQTGTEKPKYTQVRANKGGGTRDIYLSSCDTSEDIIAIAKSKFFPQGKSSFGSVSMMECDLVNSQGDSVRSFLDDKGKQCTFTVQQYMDVTSVSRLRLYLATRLKDTDESEITNPASDNGHNDSDDDLEMSVFCSKPANPKPARSKEDKGKMWRKNLNLQLASEEKAETNLIGTFDERMTLRKQQEREYDESLKQDQLKCKAKEQEQLVEKREKERAERKEAIKKLRASRVPPEPLDDSWRVAVVVQHPILGRLSRYFSRDDRLTSVYDWIGSISSDPENFELCLFPNTVCTPSSLVREVEGNVLFVSIPADDTNCDDDLEVTFKGSGGTLLCSNDDTLVSDPESSFVDLDSYFMLNQDRFVFCLYCSFNTKIVFF